MRHGKFFFVILLQFVMVASNMASESIVSSKLSCSLRRLLSEYSSKIHRAHVLTDAKATSESKSGYSVCAFVQLKDGSERALKEGGGRVLARFGDIVIADLPLASLMDVAADASVCRVEAEWGNGLTLDSMGIFTDALPLYNASTPDIPQAYTGRGVVMGVQDIGFDLTHPTFRDTDGNTLRIKCFWDQLSAGHGDLYVGAEYTDETALLSYAHSRDGINQYHGTHTLAIAAGNGAGTPYKGMAPESDICIVANAVTADAEFIPEADLYKYTYATDALGFKYIFDYAERQGKPCVISFSEGSPQDLHGDDQLYYEVLHRMTGPGRIIVASAGNEGVHDNYVGKPIGKSSAGCFFKAWGEDIAFTVKGNGKYRLSTTLYNVAKIDYMSPTVILNDGKAILDVQADHVAMCADSVRSDTIVVGGDMYVQTSTAYRSCYNQDEWAMDVVIKGPRRLGYDVPISVQTMGEDVQTDMYLVSGTMTSNAIAPSIADSDVSHSILSPSSAPTVICVGGTACRPVYINEDGKQVEQSWGVSGERGYYSSVGPTMDGRAKPDVMAPGANVVSALSSFFLENKEMSKTYVDNIISRQIYEGREYGWFAIGGTSMSAPAVGGIIALWLQANPRLTPQDVLDVIARTSNPCGDYGDATRNYCGAGMIDAYHGLLDVLKLTSIDGISCHNPKGWRVCVDADHHVSLTQCHGYNSDDVASVGVRLYNLSGVCCRQAVLDVVDGCASVDLSMLGDGVYVMQIDANGAIGRKNGNDGPNVCATCSGSLLIRL